MSKRTTPGPARACRASPKAESIRTAVLDDQQAGRAEALASSKLRRPRPSTFRTSSARPHICRLTPMPPPPPRTSARRENARHGPPLQRPGRISAGRPHRTHADPDARRADGRDEREERRPLHGRRAGNHAPAPGLLETIIRIGQGRLLQLVRLAEEGDIESLRAYAIKTYYSASIELDRFRHRAILALEARRQTERAA